MNYVTHAYVAAELLGENATHAEIFGSMVPDLAGMAGSAPNRQVEHAGLQRGIELHIKTDSVFDGQPDFVDLKVKYAQLHGEYLPRGAARLAADPGTEMLLDGFTLQKNQAVDAYRNATAAAIAGEFPYETGAKEPDIFAAFCLRHAEIGVPYFYNDPLVVAQRLHRRVAARPRLAFDESIIPVLARTFERQQADIAEVANNLISDTIRALKTPEDALGEIGPVAHILPGVAIAIGRAETDPSAQLNPSSYTGRLLGKSALSQLGLTSDGILIARGDGGEPIFPEGFVGSISHTDGWAVAVAALQNNFASIGADLERADRTFKTDISSRVASEKELESFASFGRQAGLVISSIKEAYYKAIYKYVQRRVGFKEVELAYKDNVITTNPLSSRLTEELADLNISIYNLNDGKWQLALCTIE